MSGAQQQRFAIVAVGYGRAIVKSGAARTIGAALRSIADDVDAYASGVVAYPGRDSAREQACALPATVIARVVFVPAGEADDFDGPVCAEIRAGWGCA